MKLLKNFLIPLSFLLSQHAYGVDWPVLDSKGPDTSRAATHKKIINSILTRENGGKYKGQFFKSKGQDLPEGQNQDLYSNVEFLKRHLDRGHRVQILPTSSPEVYSAFTKKCKYKILVDGQEMLKFILHAVPRPDEIQTDQTPPINHSPSILEDQASVFSGINPIQVGHGARPIRQEVNAVSDGEISRLMAAHRSKPMLDEAFKIIEGADIAQAQDRKILATYIQTYQNSIPEANVIRLMEEDLRVLKEVQRIAKRGNSSTPFRDQLKEFINFQGMNHAKLLLQGHPSLLRGEIPEELKGATGGRLLDLKTALFYVAMAKSQHTGENFGAIIAQLSSFYPGKIPGNQQIQTLLNRTHLIYGDCFFSPANAYVKNADTALSINGSFEDLPLQIEGGRNSHNFQMVFADCSGFIANIVRKLHPENRWIQNNRFMSWHIAAAYDHLMNQRQGTMGRFFDIHGNSRPLKMNEAKHLRNESGTNRLNALSQLFEPVLNPAQNIKAGDVIVTRHPTGAVEGHVMMVVDRNSLNPDEVIIVELTRADVGGTRHGYNWRRISLSNPGHGKVCRVLRIK
ncbi:MAG TPA: hypothetical protein VMW10_07305 [Alphaproteobacteria bacterium]|nr:hypothetical protein [Alphaproteobacteria bacterium]